MKKTTSKIVQNLPVQLCVLSRRVENVSHITSHIRRHTCEHRHQGSSHVSRRPSLNHTGVEMSAVVWGIVGGVLLVSTLCGLWYSRCSENERRRREEGLPTTWHPSLTGSYDPRGPRHAEFGPPPVQAALATRRPTLPHPTPRTPTIRPTRLAPPASPRPTARRGARLRPHLRRRWRPAAAAAAAGASRSPAATATRRTRKSRWTR